MRSPRPFRAGIKSYQKGYWLHQNPYRERPGSDLHQKWREGWLAAQSLETNKSKEKYLVTS